MAAIIAYYERTGRPELASESQELQFLREWQEKVRQRKPLSPREKLQRELDAAIQEEAYERAAQIRDALREIDAQR